MFQYLPLDPQNRELRVVRLQLPSAGSGFKDDKNESENERIALELRHIAMNDDIPYAAVSYVWGSTTETVEIQINGEPFAIGTNLHAALIEFRKARVDKFLWIDAICIHQSDQDEKSWHVDRMRDVFRGAELVLTWLGPATVGSDIAMDFISRLGPRAVDCGVLELRKSDIHCYFPHEKYPPRRYLKARSMSEARTCDESQFDRSEVRLGSFVYDFLHEPGWVRPELGKRTDPPDHLTGGMQNLLRRDYWHRVWVIQEITLARQGQVYCGGKVVSLDEFDAVLTTLFYCVQTEPDKMFPECQSLRGPFPGSLYPSKAMKIRHLYQLERLDPHPDCTIRMVDILLAPYSAPHRYLYTASDPRDLVYGLLGVLSDEQRLGMYANYNKTPGEVLAQFTKALLRQPEQYSQFSLNYSFPKRNMKIPYPTWVPDWEAIGKYGVIPWPFGTGRCATENLSQPASANDELGDVLVLSRWGCRVAVVTEVMAQQEWDKPEWPWDWKIKNFDQWLEAVRSFTGLGSESGPGEDYIWRTVAMNSEQLNKFGLHQWEKKHHPLVRRIMRREQIDPASLTEDEAEFYWKGPYAFYLNAWGINELEKRVEQLFYKWPKRLPLAERTLFKTNKGMFGICHEAVQPGDIVTLIWEVDAPIILRARDGGGFTMQGDAHVDGIMNGEFLETNPTHEEFVLY